MGDRISRRPPAAAGPPTAGGRPRRPRGPGEAAAAPDGLDPTPTGGRVHERERQAGEALVAPRAAGRTGRAGRRSGDEWAVLGQELSAIVAAHPGASRREVARRFARAILGQPRWAHLFVRSPPTDLAQVSDAIGDAVERSPHFRQMVDAILDGGGPAHGR